LIGSTIGTDAWTAWVGHGPGTISREMQGYLFHDPTWAKLLFEYGVFGFVGFPALFLVALRRRDVPVQIRAIMFFAWLLMGGHLLSPELNFLMLALIGLVPVALQDGPAFQSESMGSTIRQVSFRPSGELWRH
jgi:hypothetical protein